MIQQALSYVDPTDRDTWVEMAMAVKSELGEAGFEIWNTWSAQADNYKSGSARSVWRSIKQVGGITIQSLYARAQQNGWVGEGDQRPIEKRSPRRADIEDAASRARRHAKAAIKAQQMIDAAQYRVHPYLARKGHVNERVLVHDGLLIVPIRDARTKNLNSIQTISADGEKKFLYGSRTKGGVFVLGSGNETYLCEGFATGLSIKAALGSLYRTARVVVCFSASNMAFLAHRYRGLVIADNDVSGTGQNYAEKTGLDWWMPPVGDANDYHLNHGVRALADALNSVRRACQR